MGLFLNIVIVKGRGIFPVKKYLRLIAESSNNFGIEPGECIIRPASKGTLVQLNSPYGYKELASALSVQSKGEVLLCYIYDDDFWGYHLYNNGEEAGCFCPIPDYFGDMDEEEALSMSAGDAEILSCIFDVPVERISNYFCRWTDLVLSLIHI